MRYWTSYKYRRRDKSRHKSQFCGAPKCYVRQYHKTFRAKERAELDKVIRGNEFGFIPEKHRNAAKWDWW